MVHGVQDLTNLLTISTTESNFKVQKEQKQIDFEPIKADLSESYKVPCLFVIWTYQAYLIELTQITQITCLALHQQYGFAFWSEL
jgi:hypothetical protein